MAVAIDASSPAAIKGSGSTIVTAAFTTPANVKLVAVIFANSGSPANTQIVSGAGLTWARQVQSPTAGASTTASYATIWTADSAAALTAQTVTTTKGNISGGGGEAMMKVYVVTGAEVGFTGATNTAAANPGLPSVNLTPNAASGSLLVAAVSDWGAVGPAATSYAPGTGQTADAQDWVSAQYGGAIWHQTALTANNSVATLNLTGPSGENYQMVVLEVRAPAAASTVRPGLPNRRFWRAAHRSANI